MEPVFIRNGKHRVVEKAPRQSNVNIKAYKTYLNIS